MSIKNKILKLLTTEGSYEIPSEIYNRVMNKCNKDKIFYEDAITMALELWLSDRSDIRVKYLKLKTEEIRKRISKRKYLIIHNTEIYYDSFNVYPYVQKKKGIYEVHVNYYLNGTKVAGSIEFDLNDL